MSPASRTARPRRPGDGERLAIRGYGAQNRAAARLIHAALLRGELAWIGLADRGAGGADDLVLGLPDRVIVHQFKHSDTPVPFRLQTVLLGAKGLLGTFVEGWRDLRAEGHPRVEIHLVTSHLPSDAADDPVGRGALHHTAAFLRDHEAAPERSLDAWRGTPWGEFVEGLHVASGLDAAEFTRFLGAFRVRSGERFFDAGDVDPRSEAEIGEIHDLLWRLVGNRGERERWDRAALLAELGWHDRDTTHHVHRFPVGAHVQRNTATEEALRRLVERTSRGYLSLLGPPGIGKSTLLQTALEIASDRRVLRYLAFVPGSAHGLGRGEADDFLDDLATQLIGSGLLSPTFRAVALPERRRRLHELLRQAAERYRTERVRTLLVHGHINSGA